MIPDFLPQSNNACTTRYIQQRFDIERNPLTNVYDFANVATPVNEPFFTAVSGALYVFDQLTFNLSYFTPAEYAIAPYKFDPDTGPVFTGLMPEARLKWRTAQGSDAGLIYPFPLLHYYEAYPIRLFTEAPAGNVNEGTAILDLTLAGALKAPDDWEEGYAAQIQAYLMFRVFEITDPKLKSRIRKYGVMGVGLCNDDNEQ